MDSNQATQHETFRSINEIPLILGIERRVFMAAVAFAYAAFRYANFLTDHPVVLTGLLFAAFLWAGRYVTKTDPKLPAILVQNLYQKTFYDPFLYERRK